MTPENERSRALEPLLEHTAWVRGLARRLVADPGVADDLVQDTWTAALERPPRLALSPAAARSWLGTTLRNFARARSRGEGARRAREEVGARREALPSPAELLAEVESQRLLVEQVLALDEPYRHTLLLRYFKDLDAASIARREGVPGATVRWRLKRGLEELRARLRDRAGADWALVLFPWAHGPAPAPPAPPAPHASPVPLALSIGALTMEVSKIAIVVALGAALGIGYGLWPRERADAAEAESALAPVPELARVARPAAPPALAEREAPAPAPERQTIAATPAEEKEQPPRAAPEEEPELLESTLRMRFEDTRGEPLPGVLVRVVGLGEDVPTHAEWDAQPLAVSDGSGEAAVRAWLAEGRHEPRVLAAAPGYAAACRRAMLEAGRETHLGTIVLDAGGTLSGRVIDATGAPVAGAEVLATRGETTDGNPGQIARHGPLSTAGLFHDVGRAEPAPPSVRSDAAGRFTIPHVPVGKARVWAHAEGMRWGASSPAAVALARTTYDVEVRLEPLHAEDRIAGRVLLPDGTPLSHARVAYDFSDSDLGMSSMVLADADGRFELVLYRTVPHGFSVEDQEGAYRPAEARDVAPGTLDLELVLGTARMLELTVRDPDGAPVPWFATRLQALDPAGGSTRTHEEREAEHPDGKTRILVPESTFELEVRAPGFETARLGPYEPDGLAATLECTLARTAGVTGTVLGEDGPLAGARVMLFEAARQYHFAYDGFPVLYNPTPASTALTRSDGTFALSVPKSADYVVRAEAEGLVATELDTGYLHAGVGKSGLVLELGQGGTLLVQVVGEPGQSTAGIIVGIGRGDAHARTARTDADGLVRFEGLVPGPWLVRRNESELARNSHTSTSWDTEADERATLDASCEVLEGRTTRHVLRLEED